MAQTLTIAATGASANIIDLDPSMSMTMMQLTVTSGSSGTSWVQYTLDDPSAAGNVVTWANLSSTLISSVMDGGLGQTLTVLSPVSGLRMFAQSSTTTGVVGTITLKVIQSVHG